MSYTRLYMQAGISAGLHMVGYGPTIHLIEHSVKTVERGASE